MRENVIMYSIKSGKLNKVYVQNENVVMGYDTLHAHMHIHT